ncbi:hypothetical protein [Synechococcus sp. RS9916]|uniref:hypothetical protein n=1 Tax=Synechococcus sp. RS9916 TaxID=221359 RepID=UPI0000E534E1|nr:hypothetical protein [Synechococcus sp. RS9916]EAU74224.1 hypothetical protein RS9916_31992 [Synechococcus sp. RS9916]
MADPKNTEDQALSLNHQDFDAEIPLELLANVSGGKNTRATQKGCGRKNPSKIHKELKYIIKEKYEREFGPTMHKAYNKN